MSSEQYQIFRQDYDRHNALQWLCNSCKGQNKEIIQSETSITWGKMKDLKKIRKIIDSVFQKIDRWKKTICKSQEEKLEKHLLQKCLVLQDSLTAVKDGSQ